MTRTEKPRSVRRTVRSRLVLPVGWSGLVALIAGTAALAMTLITLAGGHMQAALLCGVAAIGLNTWAFFAYRATDAFSDDHLEYLKARRDHAIYRTHYPLRGEHGSQ
ncbi:hypothetical protein DFR67_10582 [Williamsia limnetica]|uniref:Uncharacterized protein n=1 Tax=Williamsia limnetica TaxID=882452 RepID=A0A318S2T7_WILLI|nr:hypothetical protein [Williamsia limnetica]PYE17937.1 hypothetical protein DFR67_10582 [Williamsia limnetica]